MGENTFFAGCYVNPSPEASAKVKDSNLRRVLFATVPKPDCFQQNRPIAPPHSLDLLWDQKLA
ncbi:hypothetical protein JOE33_004091 [Pseudomonas sp. PvP027]|nr:hypothetical protein [Pseudomonas sp. PvP027]